MRNMSDVIENYLKQLLKESKHEVVEIKRAHIAEKFDCVPSQLNYVIKTRFTTEQGYLVESKRGGGGYIRITKVMTHSKAQFLEYVRTLIGHSMSQQKAAHIIQALREHEVLTSKEAKIVLAVIDRETLMIELPYRDRLRANIIHRVIETILYSEV